jgi:hypothetical protein
MVAIAEVPTLGTACIDAAFKAMVRQAFRASRPRASHEAATYRPSMFRRAA